MFNQTISRKRLAIAVLLAIQSFSAYAEEETKNEDSKEEAAVLKEVQVTASADANAKGLTKPYAGGQVARGGKLGVLGNQDNMDTPFSINSYTRELIENQQAKSVGDVLLNDPSVRVARGFGNFQESYFIRGFILNSDSVAYNGLYGLLPRQYIAAELFERVEVLRGASAFLNGASPFGDAIGGSISLLPKRAPNEPVNAVTAGWSSGNQTLLAADFATRFGPDNKAGIRFNAARREGGTAIEKEHVELDLFSLAFDWRDDNFRLSADIAHQNNKLKQTRTNVTISGLTSIPSAPKSDSNWAQPWSYSNEKDLFGTLRAEYDFSKNITGWIAGGFRTSDEANALANLTVTNASTGAGSVYRFENTREDNVKTGELGLKGVFHTGPISHEWVVSASRFDFEKKNAYLMDYSNSLGTNLYNPVYWPSPAVSGTASRGATLDNPVLTGKTELVSYAIGDTLSLMDDRIKFTLGLRNQKFDITNLNYSRVVTSEYEKSKVSPIYGVVYKPFKEMSVYANYIEGLNEGATAPSTTINRGEMLAPYVSKQKEIGTKFDFGKLGLTATYFTTEKPRGVVNASNVFTNEGSDQHQGVELMSYGLITDGVKVLGGITLLDTEQKDVNDSRYEGKRTIGVPSKQANLGLELNVPGVNGLTVDTRIISTDHVYADAANTLKVPGWTRLDIGARYITEINGHGLTLRARIDNLTDRDYWASSGGYPGQGYLVLGAPRTVSLSAKLDF